MTRYVVKVRRTYGDHEATSVLTMPSTHEEARARLDELNTSYQEPGNLYIEEWAEKGWNL